MFSTPDAIALVGVCIVLFGILWKTKKDEKPPGHKPEEIPKVCPEHKSLCDGIKLNHDNIEKLFQVSTDTNSRVIRIEALLENDDRKGRR